MQCWRMIVSLSIELKKCYFLIPVKRLNDCFTDKILSGTIISNWAVVLLAEFIHSLYKDQDGSYPMCCPHSSIYCIYFFHLMILGEYLFFAG